MRKIIISLGGSFVSPKDTADQQRTEAIIDAYLTWLKNLSQKAIVAVIVGGGNRARQAIQLAKKNRPNISDEELDLIGIEATRENALLLSKRAGLVQPIITDPTIKLPDTPGLWFGGGWIPGRSTDHSAVQLAIANQATIITNVSNIVYVYDRDPKKYPNAKPITEIRWEDYKKIAGRTWYPGLHVPFDPVATQIAADHGLVVNIVSGWNLRNVERAIRGEQFTGTVIHS